MNKLIESGKEQTSFNKEEFKELLSNIGLFGGDQNLVDKLFWVFDNDGDGKVDYKELAVGLEMLKQNSF
jgi:Ca2+-binding EF-hand superfamily protein